MAPRATDVPGGFSLEWFYDDYPRIEGELQAALDASLDPRGSEMLYDLVAGLGLAPGATALDVGCGEGAHTIGLARSFGLDVTGIDPVARHIELGRAELAAVAASDAGLGDRVRFEIGSAEAIPAADDSVDLVWCRDVLEHVADLDGAFGEFCRVLRPGGRAVVFQMFGTDLLEPREAGWLWATMGVVPASADPARTDAAIAAAGLRVDERLDIGTEWGEHAEERSGTGGRQLLHASRLLRAPDRYIERFGRAAYDVMLGDCLWHVYGMIGKLSRRVDVLSRP